MKADARENGVEEATNAVPVSIGIIALAPAVGKTPFWARKLEFSHIVVIMNDVIWDQPIRGKGTLSVSRFAWTITTPASSGQRVMRLRTRTDSR